MKSKISLSLIACLCAMNLSANDEQIAQNAQELATIEVNSSDEEISSTGISEHFLRKNALFGPLVDKKIADIHFKSMSLQTNLPQIWVRLVWREFGA